MIVEALFDLLFSILEDFLSFIPDVSWTVEGSFFDVFLDVLKMVCYMFPMDTVTSILTIVIAVNIFRVVIAFIKAVWDLLPFL